MPIVGFRLVILAALLCIVNLALAIVLIQVHRFNTEAAQQTATDLFDQIGGRIQESIQVRMDQALMAAEILGNLQDAAAPPTGMEFEHKIFSPLHAMEHLNPSLYSAYIGYSGGEFIQLIAVRNHPAIISALKAPMGTLQARRIIVTEAGARVERWWFVGEGGRILEHRREVNAAYDPRQRPWYGGAMAINKTALSDPYVFSSTAKPGITASQRLPGSNGVAGVDITLDGLNDLAASQTFPPTVGSYLPMLKEDYWELMKKLEAASRRLLH